MAREEQGMKILIVEADDARAEMYKQNSARDYPTSQRAKTISEGQRILRSGKDFNKVCCGGSYMDVDAFIKLKAAAA
ncbi:MAG: hypothetical protein KGH79_00425 [Patescibacteria group bacterium]|nr:hypothetical protein [Patescibacteria group bacterium]